LKIGDVYRKVHGRISSKPTNFGWVIDNKLAGSGLPTTHEEFDWILSQGIKSFVTVREAPLPSIWVNNGQEVGYLHLRVDDFDAPSLEEIDSAVEFIESEMAKGKPVMVHCAAGKGRTGVILAAYLIKKQGLSSEAAIEKIRGMRPGSVQSEVQERAVEFYEKYVLSKK